MNFNSLKSFFGSGFGKVDTDISVAITANGLGVQMKDGNYAIYDKVAKSITVVPESLAFADIPLFCFPATELAEGDLVIQNGFLKHVVAVDTEGKTVMVINPRTQELQTLVPTKTMLGYVYASKVFSPFESFGKAFTGGDAAGGLDKNMLMMMALSGGDLFGDGDGDNGLMMAMAMGGFGGAAGGANPMGNLLPLLFMSKAFKD